jgi:hypothetical protein
MKNGGWCIVNNGFHILKPAAPYVFADGKAHQLMDFSFHPLMKKG